MTPQQLELISDHFPLVALSQEYDAITRDSMPVMTERVAAKEDLVAQMAAYIEANSLLPFGVLAFNTGLRAGFTRAIGEIAIPGQLVYVALRAYTATTGPKDYNLKHQIVRAWCTLLDRFPDNTEMAPQIEADLPHLQFNADQCLQDKIDGMKARFGISV